MHTLQHPTPSRLYSLSYSFYTSPLTRLCKLVQVGIGVWGFWFMERRKWEIIQVFIFVWPCHCRADSSIFIMNTCYECIFGFKVLPLKQSKWGQGFPIILWSVLLSKQPKTERRTTGYSVRERQTLSTLLKEDKKANLAGAGFLLSALCVTAHGARCPDAGYSASPCLHMHGNTFCWSCLTTFNVHCLLVIRETTHRLFRLHLMTVFIHFTV